MDETCVAVIGNLSDGFNVVGPFDSFDDAEEWCDKFATGQPSWVMPLKSPAKLALQAHGKKGA